MNPANCYPSCTPPSTIITHAPALVHSTAPHLAFTGFDPMGYLVGAACCVVAGATLLAWRALKHA